MIRALSNIIYNIRASSEVSIDASSNFRILWGLWILIVNTPTYRWLAEVPHKLFHHTWLEMLGMSIPDFSYGFYLSLDLLVILSVSLVTLGIKARFFTAVFLLTNLIGYSIENSLGKINHGGLWFALIACCMLSDWSTRNAIVPDHKWNIHKTIVSILAICIAFGFFTAGIPKVLHWIDFDVRSSGVLKWWLSGLFTEANAGLFDVNMGEVPNFVLEGMDYLAAIFEVSAFLFLLLGKKYWKFWLIIASIFHLSNCILFGISFISYIPVYAFFLLAPLYNMKTFRNWNMLIAIVVVIGLIKITLTLLDVNLLLKVSVLNIYLAMFFWGALIVAAVWNAIKDMSKQIKIN